MKKKKSMGEVIIMTEVIEEIREGNIVGRLVYDPEPDNPREWDNLGRMVCFHKRYKLGDEHDLKPEMFNSWEELEEYLIKNEDAVVILPLYLFDHSALFMNTTGFRHLGWYGAFDSGQVGYIYATREAIKKEYGVKRISKKLKRKVEEVLLGEVETYDKFLRGEVYGYEIVRLNKCPYCGHVEEEYLDGCYGYYDEGYAREEMSRMVKIYAEKEEKCTNRGDYICNIGYACDGCPHRE